MTEREIEGMRDYGMEQNQRNELRSLLNGTTHLKIVAYFTLYIPHRSQNEEEAYELRDCRE